MAKKMSGDGETLAPAVPTEVVYATSGGLKWIPFVVSKVACEAVRNGEQPGFIFKALLGMCERN